MNPRKLGKKAAQYDHRDLMLERYLDYSKLPLLPHSFGNETLFADWGMFGNDEAGDCVWAGAAHETMLWTAVGDPVTAVFDTKSVLSDYSAVTGYDASDPNSDQGTDMHDATKYRQQVGIVDALGNRHKIGAYAWLEPGNYLAMLHAVHLFKAVGLGFEIPNSAIDQNQDGRSWRVVGGSRIVGGHYVPAVAKRKNLQVITWGATQGVSEGFYKRYNDEACVMFSEEMLVAGRSIDGFDVATLLKDLAIVRR